jgi:hypothetical protein
MMPPTESNNSSSVQQQHQQQPQMAQMPSSNNSNNNFSNDNNFNSNNSSSNNRDLRAHWLAQFRLLLALVQHEPSVLCQCMNHQLDRIVACNRSLHTATERALWWALFCAIICKYFDLEIARQNTVS